MTSPSLEHELEDCDWIVAKIRTDYDYAQRVYAALCNMQWQKREVMPILKDDTWSCTWRYAGGMMAHIARRNEDYMDYYCSGNEGFVADDVREDFLKLGWQPVPFDDEDLV
jgi:hypothetical protein